MVSGIIPAMIIPLLTDTLDLYYFPVILVISLAGSIIGAYSFAPTSEKVLIDFYKKTKPWGFWKPILEKVKKEDPQFEKNTNFSRDMFNVLVGVIAQTLLVLIPLYLILHENIPFLVAIAVLVICVIILKKNWWDHIKNEENINLK